MDRWALEEGEEDLAELVRLQTGDHSCDQRHPALHTQSTSTSRNTLSNIDHILQHEIRSATCHHDKSDPDSSCKPVRCGKGFPPLLQPL